MPSLHVPLCQRENLLERVVFAEQVLVSFRRLKETTFRVWRKWHRTVGELMSHGAYREHDCIVLWEKYRGGNIMMVVPPKRWAWGDNRN